jgi:PBSX family phage terminase large subunit
MKSLPPGDAMICGVSRETIQRNILSLISDLCSIPLPTSKATYFYLLGRKVHIVGAPDEGAVRRIKGSTLAMAYIDELDDIPEPFYKMILSRLSVPGARLIATCNPQGPNHWLKKHVIDNETIDCKTISFTLDDNPVLDETYKEEIKKEYTGVWYDRFILGKWARAEGLVFDAFDPEVNVADSLNRSSGVKIVGIDYGTTNPTAAYIIDVKPNEWPQIFVESEYYFDPAKTGFTKTDAELADDIEDFLRGITPEVIYVDPAAASFKTELQRRGLPVINALNDVLPRIKVVNRFFKEAHIVIKNSCMTLIEQLQSYSWDPKESDKGRDAPIKKDDHGVDACMYGIFSKFPTGELQEFYTPEKLEQLYRDAMREQYAEYR